MGFSLKEIWRVKKSLVVILAPIVLLPIPLLYTTKAGRCAYGLLIMAMYWMTEAIPMAVTALLPLALFPWLGIAPAKQLARNYLKDTNVLFFGGLMVAVAVEKWNLHKRIALRVLMFVGSEPRWLMFGFMATTAFLSMWISNTATTAMMVPIAQAVLTQLEKRQGQDEEGEVDRLQEETTNEESTISRQAEQKVIAVLPASVKDQIDNSPPSYNDCAKIPVADIPTSQTPDTTVADIPTSQTPLQGELDKDFEFMCKGLTLCVCYAANIGGTATLTGTGPNLVIKGQVDSLYGSDAGINFSSWFIFAFPNMLICLSIAWVWLQVQFLGPRQLCACLFRRKTKTDNTANTVIRAEYAKLGPMSFAEKAVLGHFIALALLWLSREPEFVHGWDYFFDEGYVTDATVAMAIAVLLFMFPSRRPNYLCLRWKSDTEVPGPAPGLLDWSTIQHKLSWSAVLLLGGGFALADACKESGLSRDISIMFESFRGIPPSAIVFALCIITAGFTEFTSNVSTATIFLPILAELATSLEVHPLYFMIPTAVSCSFAFMLPVATPPNAIVFAYGHLKILDMVKSGILLNIVCIAVLQLSINTWGYSYFNLGEFPSWAANITDVNNAVPNTSSPYMYDFTTVEPLNM